MRGWSTGKYADAGQVNKGYFPAQDCLGPLQRKFVVSNVDPNAVSGIWALKFTSLTILNT